jgi:hypothetical protein
MLAAMSDTKFYNPKQELTEADRIAVNNGGGTAPPTAAPMVGVEKSKFNGVYGPCDLPDGIMHAVDMKIGCKRTLVSNFGDTSKGHTFALHGAGARAVIVKTELDPIRVQGG